MGVTFIVSEILLLSKVANFPFLTMDYSPFTMSGLTIVDRLKGNVGKKLCLIGFKFYYAQSQFGIKAV